MHKKYNKYGNREMNHEKPRRIHVKCKRKNEDRLYKLLRVPQNSKCELGKMFCVDIESNENLEERHRHREKRYKVSEKHKHGEKHSRKHEKHSIVLNKELEELHNTNEDKSRKKYKEKKDKHDKERLNKIEKYLEGLNKNHKIRIQNRSSRSLENIFKQKEKRHMRREKTFHVIETRNQISNSASQEMCRLKEHKHKEHKRQKHRENKKNDLKNKKDDIPHPIVYCHIETENPFKIKKKYLENINPGEFYKDYRNYNEKKSHRRKKHSSKDQHISQSGDGFNTVEKRSKSPDRIAELPKRYKSPNHKREMDVFEKIPKIPNSSSKSPKENRILDPIKFSLRKSTSKYHHKNSSDLKILEQQNSQLRKRYKRIMKDHFREKVSNNEIDEDVLKEKKKKRERIRQSPDKLEQKKSTDYIGTQDRLREKIEDDLKSYFTKIQTLIDRKLDSLLHGSKSKDSEENYKENAKQNEKKKKRKDVSKERHRDQSQSKKQKKGRHKNEAGYDNKIIDYVKDSVTQELQIEKTSRRHKRLKSPKEHLTYKKSKNFEQIIDTAKLNKSYSNGDTAANDINQHVKYKHIHKKKNNKHYYKANDIQEPNTTSKQPAWVTNDITNNYQPNIFPKYKRSQRRLNLECKTVSIIGIPSEIKQDSLIINHTQTSTSLNIINPSEDAVEKKKQSKRFKLYYKYSLADNKCSQSGSELSSDGKSIISDSYRVVTDNSEDNSEIFLPNRGDVPKIIEQKVRKKPEETLFVKTEKHFKNEQFPKRNHKQKVALDQSKLNNITEESSNNSSQGNNNALSVNKDTNILKNSGSDYDLHLRENSEWQKSNNKKDKSRVKDKVEVVEKYRNIKSRQKNKHNGKVLYNQLISKSDINISYDSLHLNRKGELKNSLHKSKSDINHLREDESNFLAEIWSQKDKYNFSNSKPYTQTVQLPDFNKCCSILQNISSILTKPKHGGKKFKEIEKSQDRTKVQDIHDTESKGYENVTNNEVSVKNLWQKSTKRTFGSENLNTFSNPTLKKLVDIGVEVKSNSSKTEMFKENVKYIQKPATADIAVEAKVSSCYRQRKEFSTKATELIMQESNPTKERSVSKFPNEKIDFNNFTKKRNKDTKVEFRPKRCEQIKTKVVDNLETICKPNTISEVYNFEVLKKAPTTTEKSTKTFDWLQEIKEIPSKKCIALNTSESTIIKNYSKQNRSISCSNDNRANKKVNFLPISKSASSLLDLNDESEESKITSLACFNKFINNTRLTLSSKSNTRSLDQYYGKSITADHKSRLFLTKDYRSPCINSYQRRKLYDERIRKKMKKRCQNPNRILAPQIYEVRFLTIEKEKSKEELVKPDVPKQKPVSKLPILKTRKRGCRKFRKSASKKLSTEKVSGRNPYEPANDVDQLNKFSKKKFPEKIIEEIFVKNEALSEKKDSSIFGFAKQLSDIKSSSLLKTNSAMKNNFERNNAFDLEQNSNFTNLVDYLCKSIISYCHTNINLLEELSAESPTDSIHEIVLTNLQKFQNETEVIKEKSYVVLDKPTLENKDTNDKEVSKISNNFSCPLFQNPSPSFEFLYEDESNNISREAMLANLSKPLNPILGYALSQKNVVLHRENFSTYIKRYDQISNTPTESGESGYSSNMSKKCSSVASFFKRPSIRALFKPVDKIENTLKHVPFNSPEDKRLLEYESMSQKCQEYAERVREQSELKGELEDEYQEIPLDVLLGRKSSNLLQNFNSNCSLCQELSIPELKYDKSKNEINDHIEKKISIVNLISTEKATTESLEQNEEKIDSLIYYDYPIHKSSLEIVKNYNSECKFSKSTVSQNLMDEILDCHVIVSNTNLNALSLTLIDLGELNGAGDGTMEKKDVFISKSEIIPRSYLKSDIVEFANTENIIKRSGSDIINKEFTHSQVDHIVNTNEMSLAFMNSPINVKKVLAKKFFENLLLVYEKEIAVTKRLFEDDNFFVNHLLSTINVAKNDEERIDIKMKKKRKLDIVKRKFKEYIERVLPLKNNTEIESVYGSSVINKREIKCTNFENEHQDNLKMLAFNARKYFSLFVQAVRENKDINDEMKIFGLLKLLERIENGDFTLLRKEEEVNFEDEIKQQIKQAFIKIYRISLKEAKKCKRSLTADDIKLISTFVSKYRIGLLSKTDLIAAYIGRGVFKTENQLKAAITYLIRLETNEINLEEFEKYCKQCES